MKSSASLPAASLAALLLAGALSACGASSAPSGSNDREHSETGVHGGHDDHSHDEAEPRKGPHGGRLLEDGDFALEVALFESGAAPQFRVYPTLSGRSIDPSSVDLAITLSRLGGKQEVFRLIPEADYLRGDGVVGEPHSFDVEVEASRGAKSYRWTYEAYEGRTTIVGDFAAEAGVETAPAGPAVIRQRVDLSGTIQLTPSARADVRAVYPGRVLKVTRTVGDMVRKGEALAQVESSSSLQAYTVNAPISGTILERLTNEGDVTGSEPLFVIADTGAVQAELHVFPKDTARVQAGQSVDVRLAGGDLTATGKIDSFLPLAERGTQSLIARVPLPRESGFRPGMRVTASAEVASTDVPLAVRESALQRFRDFTVVFARHGDTYEVRMLDLGRRDGEFVEVLGGIDPGEAYVTANSFLIKADIEKSGASHDH